MMPVMAIMTIDRDFIVGSHVGSWTVHDAVKFGLGAFRFDLGDIDFWMVLVREWLGVMDMSTRHSVAGICNRVDNRIQWQEEAVAH